MVTGSCPRARHEPTRARRPLCTSLLRNPYLSFTLAEPRRQLLVEERRLHSLAAPLQHLPVAPDHKLGEVPLDGATRWPSAQERVDGVGVRSVNIHPLHQGRCGQAVLADVERRDVGRGARLLRAELVAREEEEPQPALEVLGAQIDEAGHLPHVS